MEVKGGIAEDFFLLLRLGLALRRERQTQGRRVAIEVAHEASSGKDMGRKVVIERTDEVSLG